MKEFDFQELESATEKFSSSRLIGKGSHGSVYKGVLKDGNYVAIKKQSLGLQKLRDNSKLENEALILSLLHPNSFLINLLGTSHDGYNNKVLVMEYMPNGTLHQLIHFSPKPPPWPKRVEIALQIARAVHFLHDSNHVFVHRDIKSCNILFDSNWNVKLADFGLAVHLTDDKVLNLPAGTIGYLDPEYVTPGKLSTKIDVFSYGVVLLELISGRKAIDVVRSPASIVDWAIPLIKKGELVKICDKRVQLPRYMVGTINMLCRIAARCVSPVRPCIGEIVDKFENPIAVEPFRFRLMMLDCLHYVRFKLSVNKCSSVAYENDDREGSSDNIDMSNRTLLLREILADFPLK